MKTSDVILTNQFGANGAEYSTITFGKFSEDSRVINRDYLLTNINRFNNQYAKLLSGAIIGKNTRAALNKISAAEIVTTEEKIIFEKYKKDV